MNRRNFFKFIGQAAAALGAASVVSLPEITEKPKLAGVDTKIEVDNSEKWIDINNCTRCVCVNGNGEAWEVDLTTGNLTGIPFPIEEYFSYNYSD